MKDYELKKGELKEFISSILKQREEQSGLWFMPFWKVLKLFFLM